MSEAREPGWYWATPYGGFSKRPYEYAEGAWWWDEEPHFEEMEWVGPRIPSPDTRPASQPGAALTDTVREAVTDFAAKKIAHVVHKDPPPPDFNENIARAVAAHALSDAAVERAAEAIDPMAFNQDDPRWARGTGEMAAFLAREKATAREKARAAITAALAEGGKS